MRTIEIDFDVFKTLTARLANEHQSYNDVLRELLKLPARVRDPFPTNRPAWISRGTSVPDGTEFRVHYKKKSYFARVVGSQLIFNGREAVTLSNAAKLITGNNVNGWDFWECQLPGETGWRKASTLRRRSP